MSFTLQLIDDSLINFALHSTYYRLITTCRIVAFLLTIMAVNALIKRRATMLGLVIGIRIVWSISGIIFRWHDKLRDFQRL